MDFAYLWSFSVGGSAINGATPSSFIFYALNDRSLELCPKVAGLRHPEQWQNTVSKEFFQWIIYLSNWLSCPPPPSPSAWLWLLSAFSGDPAAQFQSKAVYARAWKDSALQCMPGHGRTVHCSVCQGLEGQCSAVQSSAVKYSVCKGKDGTAFCMHNKAAINL